MGAFLSAAAGCVAVGPALDPEAPVVEISAPQVVGCCDDLIIEGIASYPSTGMQDVFPYDTYRQKCFAMWFCITRTSAHVETFLTLSPVDVLFTRRKRQRPSYVQKNPAPKITIKLDSRPLGGNAEQMEKALCSTKLNAIGRSMLQRQRAVGIRYVCRRLGMGRQLQS